MLLSNQTPDYRYGGIVGSVEPYDKNSHPTYPEIDLGAFQMRWQTMRLEAMSKWYQHWRDLSRFINPKRGFFEGFVPNYNAQTDDRLILDGAPAHYSRILAAGMQSGLTSPAMRWFKLGLENEELEKFDPVKWWLNTVENTMYSIFSKSNIYDCFHQNYEELGMFGTGAFGVFEDYHDVIRGRSYTIGEYYLSTDYAGRVNGFARQYWMTVDQLVNQFGWNNCSSMVQRIYNAAQRDAYILVYEVCEENTAKVPGAEDFKGFKYRSVKWEAQATYKRALKISGYHEFPFMAPRWAMTTTADVYGVGPGWYSRGDIKSLYRMKKDLFLITNKIADPPVMIRGEIEGTANMLPGGISRTSSTVPNAGAQAAYQIQGDPVTPLRNAINELKDQIAKNFYADLFLMMIESPQTEKTAREIVERHEEKLLQLGPVIGRVKSDMLDPVIDRTFNIALRAGLIPPPPPQIMGMAIIPRYVSLLAQAQKMQQTAAIEQGVAFVGNLNGVYPEAKDNINPDEAVRLYLDSLGVETKIVRSPDEVQKMRDERAKQQKQMQDQQNALAAVQAAKNLADTKVGAGSALEHMLGVGGEQQGVGQPTPEGTA